MKRLLTLVLCLCAAAAHADPQADVRRAFDRVLAAGGFRGYAQGNVFGPGLPPLAGEVDVVFPDRIHVRTDDLEFVALPQRAWISAFGVWTPTDRSLLPVTAFDVAAMRKAIASIRDVRLVGAARTQQCPAHEYRFHSNGRLPGAATSGDVRAWLCDGSGKPARIEATGAEDTHLTFDFDWTRPPDVRAPQH